MLRILGIVALVLGLILLALANYGALKGALVADDESQQIAAEARKSIPRPQLPPPPQGRTVVEGYEDIFQEIQVPAPTWGDLSRTQTIRTKIASIPKVRVIEPSSEEVQIWKLKTTKLNAKYQEDLEEKIRAIQQQRKKEFREAVESWVKIIGGSISGLGGLITTVVSVKKELPARSGRGRSRSRGR